MSNLLQRRLFYKSLNYGTISRLSKSSVCDNLLFTIKNKRRKTKQRSLMCQNSAQNKWLNIELCTNLVKACLHFFTLLISHINHIKYSNIFFSQTDGKKKSPFDWHATICATHFNIKHKTIAVVTFKLKSLSACFVLNNTSFLLLSTRNIQNCIHPEISHHYFLFGTSLNVGKLLLDRLEML